MKLTAGIVTYYSFYNYGSILQALSLSHALRSFDVDVFLIDYADYSKKWNRRLKRRNLIRRLAYSVFHPSGLAYVIKSKNVEKKVVSPSRELVIKFDSFISKYFTKPDFDYTKKNSELDLFIAGSDQIWQLNSPGLHYIFFLRFCDKEKRFSYAASFGTTTVPKYNRSALNKFLNGFSMISVREDVGECIVKSNSKNEARLVLDPVLLYEKEWWLTIAKRINIKERFLLCYFLGNPEEYLKTINDIARLKGLSIVWIETGFEKRSLNDFVVSPNPQQFIDLFNGCDYVCTDSLHGTEFAITFKRDFTVFERNYLIGEEQNSRIASLLRILNLENRMIHHKHNSTKAYDEIDYNEIDGILKSRRSFSFSYIKDVLKKASKKK